MKKIQLSIPTPCHENWEAMKHEDRGRFCGSCQKTVIDFTSMSDRQIAEFFKMPAGSMCGRFHQDQLEKPLEVPKKRIPWVRYFFQIIWPAVVFMLKSCGQKKEVMGKAMAIENIKKETGDSVLATMGMILPYITPVDSLPVVHKPKAAAPVEEPPVVGELNASDTITGRTAIRPMADTGNLQISIGKTRLDTVNVFGHGSDCQRNVVMGGLSISTTPRVKKEMPLTESPKQSMEAIAYPNPVKAGGQLTVSLKTGHDEPKQVQLFSSSGGLLPLQQHGSFNDKRLVVSLPSSVAAGTYFLRIVSKGNQSSTVKIVVD